MSKNMFSLRLTELLKVVENWDLNHGPIYATWFGPIISNVHITKAELAEVINTRELSHKLFKWE